VIGSYHRSDPKFTVMVDGKERNIRTDADHFLVLNSGYYGLSLSRKQVDAVYENFRCLLVHNASIAPGQVLSLGGSDEPPFYLRDQIVDGIGLGGLLGLSEQAVAQFLRIVDSLANSEQAVAIMKKSPRGKYTKRRPKAALSREHRLERARRSKSAAVMRP